MRKLLAVPVILAAMVLAGCSGATSGAGSSPTGNGGANPYGVTADAALAKALPASIAKSGQLRIATDPTYAPNEFKNADGTMIGSDIDLGNALAAALGVKAVWTQSTFDNIIPGVAGGRYDGGISAFGDTAQREQQVDFVNYYRAGTQWAVAKGASADPADGCGMKVAVETGTTQALSEIPAKSKACVAQGRKGIQMFKFGGFSGAVNALVLGQVDAMSGDSPNIEYAVHQQPEKLQVAGPPFDAVPYGIAVAKGAPLGHALQGALQHLIDNGVYLRILKKWGVEAGAVTSAGINEASAQK